MNLKHTLHLILTALSLSAGTAWSADAPLRPVGIARVDITPDYPIRLTGYGNRTEESAGVAQRLFAKALAKALAIGGDADGPAVLVVGSAGFAANRRTMKNGQVVRMGATAPTDHDLPVLRVTAADGKVRAVFTSYACHCTTLTSAFNEVHGDWAGSAQEALEREFPGAVALIALGCGADANPAPRGEVVVDYSLRLKREFGARLWMNAYANDVPCYIPSRRILAEGGYEAEGAMTFYDRPTKLAPEVEESIIGAVHELMPKQFPAAVTMRP